MFSVISFKDEYSTVLNVIEPTINLKKQWRLTKHYQVDHMSFFVLEKKAYVPQYPE